MGIITLGGTHSRALRQLEAVTKAWWQVWRTERLINLVPRPNKWLKGQPDVKIDNIVVFLRDGKDVHVGATPWRVGRVTETEASEDGVVRTVVIQYKNENESTFRSTRRSVRTVAVLVREDDSDITGEISEFMRSAAIHKIMRSRE